MPFGWSIFGKPEPPKVDPKSVGRSQQGGSRGDGGDNNAKVKRAKEAVDKMDAALQLATLKMDNLGRQTRDASQKGDLQRAFHLLSHLVCVF